MTKKIITTYTEYDEDGKIKSQSVTETPYPEDDATLIANAATVQRRMKTMMMPYIS